MMQVKTESYINNFSKIDFGTLLHVRMYKRRLCFDEKSARLLIWNTTFRILFNFPHRNIKKHRAKSFTEVCWSPNEAATQAGCSYFVHQKPKNCETSRWIDVVDEMRISEANSLISDHYHHHHHHPVFCASPPCRPPPTKPPPTKAPTTLADPCRPNPCQNQGTCHPYNGNKDYECICAVGFEGKHCEGGSLITFFRYTFL